MIANVDRGNHWVLVTGAGNGYYNINDPGYNRETVPSGQVVQFGWYSRLRLPIKINSWLANVK